MNKRILALALSLTALLTTFESAQADRGNAAPDTMATEFLWVPSERTPDTMATDFLWVPAERVPDTMATEFLWLPAERPLDLMATEFLWLPVKSTVIASK